MAIKLYKPTTPGRRGASVVFNAEIKKAKRKKFLTFIKKQRAGRSRGKVAVRHQGGGAKRFIRIIDFKRKKFDLPAKVIGLEYDPNRTAYIALVQYSDGEKRYIIAPESLKIGEEIISSKKQIEQNIGNCMPLEFIYPGTVIHNIELQPEKGGEIVRSAGAGAILMNCEGKYAQIKLPSGEIRLVAKNCLATIGRVSKAEHQLVRLGKAGRTRHKNIRPRVRGKAMSPRDHPHGGGEGVNPIGLRAPKTLWGKPAYGVKTRKRKKWSTKLILKRRK